MSSRSRVPPAPPAAATSLTAGQAIERLHGAVVAGKVSDKPTVVYVLAQPERIGQLTSEALMVRSLYPVERYEVVLVTPPVAAPDVNLAVFESFTRGMTLLHRDREECIALGLLEAGRVEHDGIAYLLHDPNGLTEAFVERDRWEKICETLRLDETGLAAAQALRRQLGLSLEAPLVTLHARDSGFLPHLGHHSFRDADIRNYLPTIRHLLGQGYVVIRLGDGRMRPLELEHANLLDAPFHPDYRPEVDLLCVATSRFMVATTSGPCWIARAFGVPTIYLNCQVQSQLYPGGQDLCAFKKYFVSEAGRALSYQEIAHSQLPSMHATNMYTMRGISLIENTPAEILRVTVEMEGRVNGSYRADERLEGAVRQINRLADLGRRDGTIEDPRFRFFAPAYSPASLSNEIVRANPGYIVAL